MALACGTKLGPYEILAPLGAGGMGEVYRAHDIRLGRIVAIKVLSSEFSSHPERRKRLEREARTLSSLSHPHICPLFDIGQHDGIDFLVMEYLDGETLACKLLRGPLPADQLLGYGMQIADAVEAAHRHAIIHRDLKPGNIMLTKQGAKLLDFGLARLEPKATPVSETLSHLATDDKLTEKGAILGTFQYMAPEQVEGRDADPRTDIFALGTVLYEMATGRLAFAGKTRASLIAAILTSEPPAMTSLQPLTPPMLEQVVKTCLAKDPDARWQSAQDLKLQLQWIREGGSQAGVPAPLAKRRRVREQVAWSLVGTLAVALGILALGYLKRAPQPRQRVNLVINAPPELSFNYLMHFAVSPDGRQLAFIPSDGKIWVQRLDEFTSVPMRDTEGAQSLFWSADSRFLGFKIEKRLRRLEPATGKLETLCDSIPGVDFSWNRDGIILSAELNEPIKRANIKDCKVTPVTRLDSARGELFQLYPRFLPDGHQFLYLSRFNGSQGQNSIGGLNVGSLDSTRTSLLTRKESNAAYVAPGYLLFGNEGTFLVQPFDTKNGQLTGEALPLSEPQAAFNGGDAYTNFSVSENRVLVYQPEPQIDYKLQWVDRNGKKLDELLPPGKYGRMRLSADAKQIVLARAEAGSHRGDLWTWDIERKIWNRLTYHSSPGGGFGVWSPDKRHIAISIYESGVQHLYLKDADGSGEEQLLPASANWMRPWDWSRDGKFLVYSQHSETSEELRVLSMTGDQKTPQIAIGLGTDARFSPDGQSIVYASDKSGRSEIYVQSFPVHGRAWQISTGGGDSPRWSRDGKELFFISPNDKLMAARIGANLHTETPMPLFDLKSSEDTEFEVSPDGRFLLGVPVKEVTSFPLHVIVNWSPGLSSE